MTDRNAAAVSRPASCQARIESEYAACGRCGLAWLVSGPAPACDPMTVTRLRLALLSEAAALEGSHQAVVRMKEAGMPADPVDPLQRAARLRGVLLFVDRCAGDAAIVNRLKEIARAAEREAAEHD